MGGLGHPGAGMLRVMRAEPPGPVLGQRVQGLGAEAQQNRLDDGGVIEDGARHRARLHPGRHDDRRYPDAVTAEQLGVVVWCRGRRDVVIEARTLSAASTPMSPMTQACDSLAARQTFSSAPGRWASSSSAWATTGMPPLPTVSGVRW